MLLVELTDKAFNTTPKTVSTYEDMLIALKLNKSTANGGFASVFLIQTTRLLRYQTWVGQLIHRW